MKADLLHPPFDRFDFGVCLRDAEANRLYFRIPIQPEVEAVFQDALASTVSRLKKGPEVTLDTLNEYDPSDIHASESPCSLNEDDDCLGELKQLYDIQDIETNSKILQDNAEAVFFYFCRFKKAGSYVWGIRKASTFKANLKTKSALFSGDTLALAPTKLFRLDSFFDVILHPQGLLILRPNEFEYLANLEEKLRASASKKLQEADEQLSFLDLTPLAKEMAEGGSVRRARLATSVSRRKDLAKTDRDLFLKACELLGVALEERGGVYHAKDGNGWDIISVLDRRRFWADLVSGQHEIYETPNRYRLKPKTEQ